MTIEAELARRAKTDMDADDFWHRYSVMKKYLSEEYYPWVQANCPYFTDHGSRHVESVRLTAGSLLSRQLDPGKTELSSLDLFLLLSGIIWHDVGMVYDRSGHADEVAKITKRIKEVFPGIPIQRLVEEISKAHSGNEGLDIPRAEEDYTTAKHTYKIYPRALAAVVRLADEVSENHSRISHALVDDVPARSKVYWEYAKCIVASYPDPTRGRIVVQVELQHDKVGTRMECRDFLDRTGGVPEMPLIKYTLCRLEKMNNERAYCSKYVNRFADLRSVEARFTLLRGTERVPSYDELTVVFGDLGLTSGDYPKINIVDGFFRANPAWTPQRIEEAFR